MNRDEIDKNMIEMEEFLGHIDSFQNTLSETADTRDENILTEKYNAVKQQLEKLEKDLAATFKKKFFMYSRSEKEKLVKELEVKHQGLSSENKRLASLLKIEKAIEKEIQKLPKSLEEKKLSEFRYRIANALNNLKVYRTDIERLDSNIKTLEQMPDSNREKLEKIKKDRAYVTNSLEGYHKDSLKHKAYFEENFKSIVETIRTYRSDTIDKINKDLILLRKNEEFHSVIEDEVEKTREAFQNGKITESIKIKTLRDASYYLSEMKRNPLYDGKYVASRMLEDHLEQNVNKELYDYEISHHQLPNYSANLTKPSKAPPVYKDIFPDDSMIKAESENSKKAFQKQLEGFLNKFKDTELREKMKAAQEKATSANKSRPDGFSNQRESNHQL